MTIHADIVARLVSEGYETKQFRKRCACVLANLGDLRKIPKVCTCGQNERTNGSDNAGIDDIWAFDENEKDEEGNGWCLRCRLRLADPGPCPVPDAFAFYRHEENEFIRQRVMAVEVIDTHPLEDSNILRYRQLWERLEYVHLGLDLLFVDRHGTENAFYDLLDLRRRCSLMPPRATRRAAAWELHE